MSLKRKVKSKNNYKKAFVFKTIDSGLKFFVLKEFIPNNINAFKKIYTFLFNKKISNSLTNTKAFSKKITFRFSQNNIFVNFVDLFNNKTLHTGSSGIYKIKLSKRRIKTFYRTFVYIFFNKIKKNVKDFRNTLFSLIEKGDLIKAYRLHRNLNATVNYVDYELLDDMLNNPETKDSIVKLLPNVKNLLTNFFS
jgi:hypothetical protein